MFFYLWKTLENSKHKCTHFNIINIIWLPLYHPHSPGFYLPVAAGGEMETLSQHRPGKTASMTAGGTSGTELCAPAPTVCTRGRGREGPRARRHCPAFCSPRLSEGRSLCHVTPLSPGGPAWASRSLWPPQSSFWARRASLRGTRELPWWTGVAGKMAGVGNAGLQTPKRDEGLCQRLPKSQPLLASRPLLPHGPTGYTSHTHPIRNTPRPALATCACRSTWNVARSQHKMYTWFWKLSMKKRM